MDEHTLTADAVASPEQLRASLERMQAETAELRVTMDALSTDLMTAEVAAALSGEPAPEAGENLRLRIQEAGARIASNAQAARVIEVALEARQSLDNAKLSAQQAARLSRTAAALDVACRAFDDILPLLEEKLRALHSAVYEAKAERSRAQGMLHAGIMTLDVYRSALPMRHLPNNGAPLQDRKTGAFFHNPSASEHEAAMRERLNDELCELAVNGLDLPLLQRFTLWREAVERVQREANGG